MNYNILGLRMFVAIILKMLARDEKILCGDMEKYISSGVATELSNRYSEYFEEMHKDAIKEIDDFYKNNSGVEADSYFLKDDDGLLFLLNILNDSYINECKK